MPSIIPEFSYDIFISYRHNDNRSGWVTEFVHALQEELAAAIKDPITIYFDKNPHDGLLDTHSVDKSLEGKLKCVILIPIISQTYCDPKSFAWQHEFCAFNDMAKEDQLGRDIRLSNGNVSSRILPVRIHDLDVDDLARIESAIGGALRAVEFVYKEPGINRPLNQADSKTDNQNKIDYRNQVNKVANAVKELFVGIQHAKDLPPVASAQKSVIPASGVNKLMVATVIILLAALVAFGTYYFGGWGSRIHPVEKSIAVLPFVNMSNDPEQEYFSDGMTDEILNRLFRIGDLKVISRTSSMKFKGVKLTAREIAAQLGVANILEGSVQKSGSRIKITVQLIDAASDNHLWSESYEREFKDIFAIQSEIAEGVAYELRIKLTTADKTSFEQAPTQDPLAYEYFLKGEQYWFTDFKSALKLYTKAIEEDSLFANARYARLNAHLYFYWLKADSMEFHLAAANKDIQFLQTRFPTSLEYKKALALHHYWVNRDYSGALKLYDEILTENPNDLEAILFVATINRRLGNWSSAIQGFERRLKLDPLNNDTRFQLILTFGQTHQYDKELETIKFAISISPEHQFLRNLFFYALISMGHDKDAALRESGNTREKIFMLAGYDYFDLSTTYLDRRRKEGNLLAIGQSDYTPITLDYALTYYLRGEFKLAKTYADSAQRFLLTKKPSMINDPRLYMALGTSYALSGDERLAVENGNRAMQLMPTSLDALEGPNYEFGMAVIYIILKKYDAALDMIEALLDSPSFVSVGRMMTDPLCKPLRDLPRFKKLAEKYKYTGRG